MNQKQKNKEKERKTKGTRTENKLSVAVFYKQSCKQNRQVCAPKTKRIIETFGADPGTGNGVRWDAWKMEALSEPRSKAMI